MRWLQIIRGMRNIKKEIETTEDKIQTGEISMNWKDFYDKHKVKIWAGLWTIATYFSTPLINDSINGLPVVTDVKNRITIIESDLTNIKSDINEIKKVLTPP